MAGKICSLSESFLSVKRATKKYVPLSNPCAMSYKASQFEVSLVDPTGATGSRPPKVYKVKLNKVAEINPESVIPL